MAIKDWVTQYPTNLDTATQQPAVVNSVDVTRASQINTIRDCVQALQVQIGSNNIETGSVRKRLADLEAAVTGLGEPASQTGITAFAGGGQGSATQISSSIYFNFVDTVATQDASVKLPNNSTGQAYPLLIKNRGTNRLAIFPFTGGAINSLATNVAINLRPEMQQWFIPLTSGPGWITVGVSYELNLTGSADVASDLTVGGNETIAGNTTINGLTASQAVLTNGSKQLVSQALTGTGNIVRATSPTIATATLSSPSLTGTVGTALTASQIVSTDGSSNLTTKAVTGSGSVVLATSPTISTATLSSPSLTGTVGTALTASRIVSTDGSSNLSTTATTGSGNVVLDTSPTIASPTFTGTASASVISASGVVSSNTFLRSGYTNSITAFAGGGQTNATQLTTQWNNVTTCATNGDSVKLPASPTAGDVIYIINNGAKDCAIYPGSGDTLGELAVNAAFQLHPSYRMGFVAESASQWRFASTSIRTISIGDPSANHFTESTLSVQDNTFNDLDLSTLIPPSAFGRYVYLRLAINHASAARTLTVRKNGNTNTANSAVQISQTGGQQTQGMWKIECDSSGLVEYRISASGSTIVFNVLAYEIITM